VYAGSLLVLLNRGSICSKTPLLAWTSQSAYAPTFHESSTKKDNFTTRVTDNPRNGGTLISFGIGRQVLRGNISHAITTATEEDSLEDTTHQNLDQLEQSTTMEGLTYQSTSIQSLGNHQGSWQGSTSQS
jgi:hypothetical protein